MAYKIFLKAFSFISVYTVIAKYLYTGVYMILMKMRLLGKVKVRKSSSQRGSSLEVTIPREVLLFLKIKPGDSAHVYVDEKEHKIIYCFERK